MYPCMKNQYLALCICLLIPLLAIAQPKELIIDSLLLELKTEKSDSGQLIILNSLASFYRNINLEKANFYGQQALALARETGDITNEIKSLYILGVITRMQGHKTKALTYGKQSLDLATKEEDWRWCGSNCSAIGNTYSSLGVYDTAMVYYFKAIEAYDKTPHKAKSANVYNNLGNMLYKQKKDKLAIEYLEKALKIYQKNDQMSAAAMTLMNLGRREKNDSLALDYFQQSLEIHTQNNDLQGIASVNMNIGSHYISKQQYEAALPYYQEGLRITTEVGFKSKMATAHSSMGKIYFMLDQPSQAIQQYEAAIRLSEQVRFREEEKETYNNLALLYKQQNDFEKAHRYLKLSRDIGDSLVNQQNLAITAELEAKFDAKQKEATLSQQQLTIERQKNARNQILIGGIFLLLVMTAIFQYYYFYQKRKKQEALNELGKKETEAESLRQLDQMKTKFFANISHELKTPLSMVITPLEEALEKSSDDNLVLAHHSSKKLFGLVNEILDLSKLEAGQLELIPSPVNLKKLIDRIFNAFGTLAERRRINFQLDNQLRPDIWVNLDIEKFEKILNNLLSNAIKFTPSKGLIQLQAIIQNESSLKLSVHDSGVGIPEHDIDKIFDRYYQSSSGKKAGGTGIGLALSKELTNLFGGTLKVESTHEQGSTFRLDLPIKILTSSEKVHSNEFYQSIEKPQGSAAAKLATFQALNMNGRRARILIVEDNLEMSDFLHRMISPYYDCQIAHSGDDALKKLAHTAFDLISSDLMMPEMDGLEFRKELNEHPQWRQTPFIMLTASTLERDRLKGFKLGIDDYITKPFSSKELLARIDNLLRNKLEREQFELENQTEEPIESTQQQLIRQAEEIILQHLHDPTFKVTNLAQQMNYSPRQLGRIIKKLTGLSPVNFILEVRLQKAYHFFQSRQFATVSEVRYEIGIESAAYFTTKFKERFGKSPKEFLTPK